VIGRNTQGVRLIDLGSSDRLAAVAILREKDEPPAAPDANGTGGAPPA
jgi:hypothetical protein